jgi:acyl-CoA reductase-like NAD-dependent aldehyde dehydrogenase
VAAPRLPNYIGGAWIPVDDLETLADVDPASGEALARVPL